MEKKQLVEIKKRTLSLKLRKFRLRKHLSQEELAKMIGASVFSISRWERRKHYPPNSTIKLMKLLRIL